MCLPKTYLKVFLLVINVVFFLCGAIVMGIGVWAVADKIYVADIIGSSLFASAAYLMVVTGIILVLISFLGCLGAISGKKILVIIYLILLIIVFVLLMSTAIVAAVFQDDIETNMQDRMSRTIMEKYGYDTHYQEENARITESWDKAQSSLECCGVHDEGWFVYQNSRWFSQQTNMNQGYYFNPNINMDNQKFVPISCCVYDTNMGAYLNQFNCQSFKFGPPRYMDPTAARNDALHYKGCYDAARDFIEDQSTMMLGIGFSFCVFLIAGIVVAIMFLRKISEDGGSVDLGHRMVIED